MELYYVLLDFHSAERKTFYKGFYAAILTKKMPGAWINTGHKEKRHQTWGI